MSTQTNQINGVNVDQLIETIGAIQGNPELGRFQFRATTEWQNGGHSVSKIQGFYGAGQEDTTRPEPFVVHGDEPGVLLGADAGPNAVEAVLHALTSCLSVGLAYNAAAQGITINKLEFDIQGDLDLRGFLGLSQNVRPGYEGIHIECRMDCDASAEKIEELWAHVKNTSPLLDIITRPVPVTIESK